MQRTYRRGGGGIATTVQRGEDTKNVGVLGGVGFGGGGGWDGGNKMGARDAESKRKAVERVYQKREDRDILRGCTSKEASGNNQKSIPA